MQPSTDEITLSQAARLVIFVLLLAACVLLSSPFPPPDSEAGSQTPMPTTQAAIFGNLL